MSLTDSVTWHSSSASASLSSGTPGFHVQASELPDAHSRERVRQLLLTFGQNIRTEDTGLQDRGLGLTGLVQTHRLLEVVALSTCLNA